MIIASIEHRSYLVFSATPEMLLPDSSLSLPSIFKQGNVTWLEHASKIQQLAMGHNLTQLDVKKCIEEYQKSALTYGDLVVISEKVNLTEVKKPRPGGYGIGEDPTDWMCKHNTSTQSDSDCTKALARLEENKKIQNIQNPLPELPWPPFGETAKYCLSERIPEACTMKFLPELAWIVVGCNIIKLAVLIYVHIHSKSSQPPLLTIGDAISSFLLEPDRTTTGLNSMSRKETNWWREGTSPASIPFNIRRQKWAASVSGRRWLLTVTL